MTDTPPPAQVTLLTQADCGFCDHAKHILQRVGRDFPLQVTEIDLASDDGQRLALKAGVLFAPGLLLDGEPFSFGRLSERKLRHTLDTRARRPA
ncbi:MAG: thioredoxin family protein [Actinobacteria bacterium 69-20]|nr:glutaredoxin family protein [Actinomycetota bacterium]OJV28084.1 MAG: thioredoxin family protein [Actinobacteria bacterium 69-20]